MFRLQSYQSQNEAGQRGFALRRQAATPLLYRPGPDSCIAEL
jgi:hypothetical protein